MWVVETEGLVIGRVPTAIQAMTPATVAVMPVETVAQRPSVVASAVRARLIRLCQRAKESSRQSRTSAAPLLSDRTAFCPPSSSPNNGRGAPKAEATESIKPYGLGARQPNGLFQLKDSKKCGFLRREGFESQDQDRSCAAGNTRLSS
jgi:hypothetical protein